MMRRSSYIALALLLFTIFFGAKVNDAGRWIRIPFIGLTFQSSDFAKLALILYISRLLVRKKDLLNDYKSLKYIFCFKSLLSSLHLLKPSYMQLS